MEWTDDQIREVGNLLKINWEKISFDEFKMGMNVELEHGTHFPDLNVTNDDPILTAKIALAHLREFNDYYKRLEKMEEEGKKNMTNDDISDKNIMQMFLDN